MPTPKAKSPKPAKAKKTAAPLVAERPAPAPREAEAIAAARERYRQRPKRIDTTIQRGITTPRHNDDAGHTLWLLDTMGSASNHFLAEQIGQLEQMARKRGAQEPDATALNAALAMVAAVEPRDEIEAALAVQMAGVHALTTEMLQRSRHTERTDHIQLYGGLAVKLTRTFTAQLEALTRLRSAGKQVVEVVHVHKHVYVASGGQAIIGDVHNGGGGGGGGGVQHEIADQLHAHALAHAPGAPFAALRGDDAGGHALQGAEHEGAEAMPDARRGKPRRAERTGQRQLARGSLDEGRDRCAPGGREPGAAGAAAEAPAVEARPSSPAEA